MLGTYITFPELLIWLPVLAGLFSFFASGQQSARNIAILSSLLVLGVSVASLFYASDKYQHYNNVNYYWLKYVGNSFNIGLDGTGRILTFLTAVSFPLIFIGTSAPQKRPSVYYGLMLLAQAGLMGVFVAKDALVFYFFWELALIPVYFLSSQWGGERRIPVTFKFFVYTFTGSLLMLIGILYVYNHTGARAFEDGTRSAHSFALSYFYNAHLTGGEQNFLFWLFFIAFAIKMPVFPFHTWQPDAYDQAPTPVTMVLSGVMVKMGLFAVIRWLIPIFPEASAQYTNLVMILCVTGIVYASCIAMVQDNLKKLVAYSSIAHIGLMCAAIFVRNELSVQGMMIQLFTHGVNIIGLWLVIDMIEKQTGIKQISQLRGIANKAPFLTVMLIIIALANIALPLTNAFPGEFLMFAGLFQYSKVFAAVAGLGVILSAIYTLNMIQKVFYGEVNDTTTTVTDIRWNQRLVLLVIGVIIFVTGVYPKLLVHITQSAVTAFITR